MFFLLSLCLHSDQGRAALCTPFFTKWFYIPESKCTLPRILQLWELSCDVSIFIHEFYASIFCFVFLNWHIHKSVYHQSVRKSTMKGKTKEEMLSCFDNAIVAPAGLQQFSLGKVAGQAARRSKTAVLISSWILCRAVLWTHWYKIFVTARLWVLYYVSFVTKGIYFIILLNFGFYFISEILFLLDALRLLGAFSYSWNISNKLIILMVLTFLFLIHWCCVRHGIPWIRVSSLDCTLT